MGTSTGYPTRRSSNRAQWADDNSLYDPDGEGKIRARQYAERMPATDFYKEAIDPSVTPAWSFSGTARDAGATAVVARSTITGLSDTPYNTDGYALRLKTSGTGTVRATKQPVSITGTLNASSVFVMAVYLPTALAGSAVIRFIGFDGSVSPTIAYQQASWRAGLNYLLIDGAGASPAMTATMTYNRLELESLSGVAEMYVLDFFHFSKQAIVKGFDSINNRLCSQYLGRFEPKIVIEFDDAFSSVYSTAFPLMKAAGLVGTISVIRDTVGKTASGSYTSPFGVTIDDTETYCTEAQLLEMQAAGWELVVHGYYNHANAPLSDNLAAITADVAGNQAYVRSLGGNFKSYVYPGGYIGPNSQAALQSLGFVSGRKTSFVNDFLVGMLGDEQPLATKSIVMSAAKTLAAIQANIVTAIKGCASIRLYGHRIVASPVDTANEFSTANFTTLVGDIKAYVAAGSLRATSVADVEESLGLR